MRSLVRLDGKVAAALQEHGNGVFATPTIEQIDVLAAKLP